MHSSNAPIDGTWRPARITALCGLAVVLTLTVGCGGQKDGGRAAGPACARGLPVPPGVEFAATIAAPSRTNPTCAIALSTSLDVAGVVRAFGTALEGAGVAHTVLQQGPDRAVVRLEGPVCGSVLVFAPGTKRVTDAVPSDRTPVLVSLLDCRRTGAMPQPSG